MERLPAGLGGSEVWRSERGVHRTTGPWTPTVHELLDHLEAADFDGAPRVLGFDDEGREVLTYVEGEVLGDPAWRPGDPGPWPAFARTDEALVAAADLLRRFHAAAAGFRPTRPVWKHHPWPDLLDGEIVGHGDVGRHNTVYRDGVPVAFIDWETIRPVLPLVEMGAAAWKLVPLGTARYFAASEWPEVPDLPGRLARFARAYGVVDAEQVLWAVQQARQRSLEMLRHWPIGPAEAAAQARLVATDLEWLASEARPLTRDLG